MLSTIYGDKTPHWTSQYFIFQFHSYQGLTQEIDCGLMVREAGVIQCNFQINWKKELWVCNSYSWQWATWFGFQSPTLSILQVFQHPVIVDRWIIIFLWQNNWNDSGLANLDGTKEMWGSYRTCAAKIVCTWCTEAKSLAFCLTQEYVFSTLSKYAPNRVRFDGCMSKTVCTFVQTSE